MPILAKLYSSVLSVIRESARLNSVWAIKPLTASTCISVDQRTYWI